LRLRRAPTQSLSSGFLFVLAGCLAKLGVDEEGKQRCVDNIGSDGLFVIFGLPPFFVPMPALAMSTSSFGNSDLNLSGNAKTDAYELRSRSHT
jgi:hypothetical protein